MMDTRLYPVLEDRLDWAAKRQQVLSANVNNVNTPGYHSKDISFSDQLQSLQLNTTSDKHITTSVGNSRMEQYEVRGTPDDRDNSVDMDRETTEMTKNYLMYISMIQFVNQKLRTLRSAINEGGKG